MSWTTDGDEAGVESKTSARNRVDKVLDLKDRALAAASEGIVISDARLPDNPLIYANAGFERLTGYPVEEVLGRNCRFLQGPETGRVALEGLRAALRECRECTVLLLNYRKDGTPFWNRLSITPVRDASGQVTHFIGVQTDVTVEKNAQDTLKKVNEELEAANQKLKGDLDAAALVQESFLPGGMPEIAGVRFASWYRPCTELAGDMFNAFSLDDQCVGLYILDVSGHGVAAALLSVALSRLLSFGQPLTEAKSGKSGEHALKRPAEVVEALNRRFPLNPRTFQYFTIICGVLELGSRRFRYVSGGHCHPVHVPRDGAPRVIVSGGLPVGLFPDSAYQEQVLDLQVGDRLYFYTDGVTEAENSFGQDFGLKRLLETFDSARSGTLEASLAALMDQVQGWHGSSSFADDLTVLALEVGP